MVAGHAMGLRCFRKSLRLLAKLTGTAPLTCPTQDFLRMDDSLGMQESIFKIVSLGQLESVNSRKKGKCKRFILSLKEQVKPIKLITNAKDMYPGK